ncbi:MAG: cyclic nucleotide-binding domain-containing protein [Nitrospinaceae bacterium]|jgi:CRP/FNR family transcriptional regulator, cyclic AMP receptor protein|nr:cyclic nucleotide-binding domain-containing protein [Nitrospina sp.]MBT5869158.1 cyclic nucleotide-binding domain-containing protein [Nitrospinaceae bacterium]MBT6345430.1 cyclic nucleotide-binding domain-containing protein [Nitrospina sp.]
MDHNVVDFYKNDIIFLEGQSSNCAYLIESGSVGIYREETHGNRSLVRKLGKDDLFGEMGLIDKYPRSATAIALSDIRCLVIERSRFDYLTKFNPHFLVSLIKSLSERLRTTIGKLSEVEPQNNVSLANKTTRHNDSPKRRG